jgi:hypothetical protein
METIGEQATSRIPDMVDHHGVVNGLQTSSKTKGRITKNNKKDRSKLKESKKKCVKPGRKGSVKKTQEMIHSKMNISKKKVISEKRVLWVRNIMNIMVTLENFLRIKTKVNTIKTGGITKKSKVISKIS